MTLERLHQEMSSHEFREWLVFDRIEHEDQEKQRKKIELEARNRR